MTAVATRMVSVKLDDEIHGRIELLADCQEPYCVLGDARGVPASGMGVMAGIYQEAGSHMTEDEADAWLASWGRTHGLPAPVCHE